MKQKLYFDSRDSLFALRERRREEFLRRLHQFRRAINTDEGDQFTIVALMMLIHEYFESWDDLAKKYGRGEDNKMINVIKCENQPMDPKIYAMIVRIITALMRRGRCRQDVTAEDAAYFICTPNSVALLFSPIEGASFAEISGGGRDWVERWRAMAKLFEVPADSPASD